MARKSCATTLVVWCVCLALWTQRDAIAAEPLPAEPIPNVLKLATPYPATYAMVHDFAFGSLIDSSFGLVDVTTRRFKGMLSAGQFATLDYSVKRRKFYVGETVHSRGTRGARQDVVAIYDFENLALVGEIDLPPRRMNVVVNHASTGLTTNDEFLLVFNMNPSTSVTVIDLDTEALVAEIPLPGCSLVYPDAGRGFLSLCGNGALTHVVLNDAGQEKSRSSSAVFNDIDADPLSEKAVWIGDTWYFVTYQGEVQPVRASGAAPEIGERWWLTSATEREQNWRPAGWHGKAAHPDGLMWVAMTPNGYDGSHKDPAQQVWLFDIEQRKPLQRIDLETDALSIGVTHEEQPRLLVVNVAGSLDVYDGRSGDYVHSIHELGDTPYMVHSID